MFCIRRIVIIILCTSQLRLNYAAFKGGWPVFLEWEKGSCGKYDQAVVRAFECELGRSSRMRWIRFTAAFMGVESEKPAECPRYMRDHVLEGVRS
jgi:hypothetical protein